MEFRFQIHVNERDYWDYNMFSFFRSPYGKRQARGLRLAIAVVAFVYLLVVLCGSGFTVESLLSCVPVLAVVLLIQVFFTRLFAWSLKSHTKMLKKSGRVAYSPESVMEFYEDHFVEITPETKIENKYTAVERISVVGGRMVYIHLNSAMAYMLPFSCFGSKEEYDRFMKFIRARCATVDFYS